jgi:multicomponent Na+:H+ antiporter subunit D
MPFTMTAFGLASLSLIGIPPVSGFVSKWFLSLGAMDTRNLIILSVLLTSSLLNAGYFVPVFLTAFFGTPPAGDPIAAGSLEKAPLIALMVVPLFICGLISVLLGIFPDLLLRIVRLIFVPGVL